LEPVAQGANGDAAPAAGAAKVVSTRTSRIGIPFRCWKVIILLSSLVAFEAWTSMSRKETLVDELRVLLHGLAVSCFSFDSAGAAALPSAGPDLVRDRGVFLVFALVIFILNWGTRGCVVEPLTRMFLSSKPAMLAKFSASVMEVAVYGSFTYMGCRVVASQDWVWR